MKYRRKDSDGDYVFGQGAYDYCTNIEAVAQAIQTKLELLKGEWWEDLNDGTPLFQDMLAQKVTEKGRNAIDLIIKSRIAEVPNVNSIISFTSNADTINRTYSAIISIETTFGVIEDYTIEM